MSVPHTLVILSICISVIGAFPYLRDTLRGKTKPNKVSWFLWGVAPILGTCISWSAGADPWALARILFAGLIPLVILAASFANPKSSWELDWFDYVCGFLALSALGLWVFNDTTKISIVLLATADLFASVPVLRKAWTHPETETGSIYLMSIPLFLLNIPAIPVWDIEHAAFHIYILLINTALALVVYRARFCRVLKKRV